MPPRAFRDKADFASTSWPFSNRIQAGRPAWAGAHCAPLRRETHPIRPCGGQAAAGGPQTAAQRSGCRLERRSKGAGEECPPGRSEIKRTLLRRHGGSQTGYRPGIRPGRAHTVRPYEEKRILSAPAGDKPPQAAPKRQPSGSGCRLERRSKGAGEECPPGRSEIKRTLLRRHGGSQTGYKPGVRPGQAHTVRPYEAKRILSAPAGDKPPQASPKRQPQNKTQEAPRKTRGLLLYFLTVHQPSSPSSATKRTYRFKICRV